MSAFLAMMFAGLNLMAPIAGVKVVSLWGLTFTAGSPLVALSFGFLDILNNSGGGEAARGAVAAALAVRAVFYLAVIPLILILPARIPVPGLDSILSQSIRLFAAGWVSLWAGAMAVNTPLFSTLRDRWSGRWFFLRYLLTSIPTLLAGSLVYVVLGFWGTPTDLPALFLGTVVARLLIGALISPLVWAGKVAIEHG